MAPGGAARAPQGPAPAAALGDRRILYAAPGGATEPRLVRRLRPRADAGRAAPAPPAQRGRGHAGVPQQRRVRRLRSDHVLARLTARFVQRGPAALRSDHAPAFTATAARSWLRRRGVTTLCIEPGSPWENGEVESFTSTLRDEGLNPEIFTTLTEAQILIERWRREYNQVRPHSALGSRPPAPAAIEITPPRPLGRPEAPGTHLSTGTTIGGRSPPGFRHLSCGDTWAVPRRRARQDSCGAELISWLVRA